MSFVLALLLGGYGFGYNGCEGRNYYFEVNTPKADYGLVVELDENPQVYCDVVAKKD